MGSYSTFKVYPGCLLDVSNYSKFYGNCVSIQPRPKGFFHVFSFKNDRITVKKLAVISNDTRYLSDDCLFIQSSLCKSVDRKIWYYWQNLIAYDHFLLFNKLKLLEMRNFAKNCFDLQKTVYWNWPVPCSRSEKQNNKRFISCFPNLTMWEDFE